MELFEGIRREYEFGVGTIAGVARKMGVHRRMVREALRSAVPGMKETRARGRPSLGPVMGYIEAILECDRQAPRKQRHTAHRIWVRLRQERPEYRVAESTIREYVRERKVALGLLSRETFVPQSYPLGSEAQVDWYEAEAELGGKRQVLQVFVMRSMASGGAFHCAYRRGTQQAFLEGHQLGFRYFGGPFERMRYDNLTLAIKRVLRGSRREETARFVAFRSHWRFASEFCNLGEGHEKGGVESEVGRFRRNHWVPVPEAADLEEFNERLLAGCHEEEGRLIEGREQTVGEAMLAERAHLLPLAEDDFDLTEVSFPQVNSLSCVKVRTNAYSVPAAAGTTVQAKITATAVELWREGRCLARHERCYGRYQEILDLEHYLDVLAHKPGALAGSKPLEQWRQLGRWPASYDKLWQGMIERHGRQQGTKELILLLQLGRNCGQQRLRQAVEEALGFGSTDSGMVRYLLGVAQLKRRPVLPLSVGGLDVFERPLPQVSEYDQLLAGAVDR